MDAATTPAGTMPVPESVPGLTIGRLGIWWFLSSEIMVFGGVLMACILSRIAAGGWAAESELVNTRIAAVNTLILVTSSFTIVQAHVARRNRTRVARYLLVTVLLGLTFLGVKGYEYSIELGHGYLPSTSLFWSFYYLMTGLHALHVLGGIVANFCLYVAAARGRHWTAVAHRVEYAGLYWHFVDIVWIFLFPLVYLS